MGQALLILMVCWNADNQYTAKHPGASFEEVSELFLRPYEGSLRLNQISPRCFEAAALRTPMVLIEGSYSGVLYPERHYIPLRKDFSNFDEVVKKIKDSDYLQYLADRTYQEKALNSPWSYRSFVNIVDESMKLGVQRLNTMAHLNPYTRSEFNRDLKKYQIQHEQTASTEDTSSFFGAAII